MADPNEESFLEGGSFPHRGVSGKVRKSHGGNGDSEKADRKLDQAKGVIEAGDAAVCQIGGKVAVDHDIDLDGGGSDRCGAEKAKNLFQAWIVPNKEPAGLVTEGDGAGDHHEPLGKASYQNAYGESVDGAVAESGIENPREE